MMYVIKIVAMVVFIVATLAAIPVASEFNLDSLLVLSVGGEEAVASLRNVTTVYGAGQAVLNGVPASFEMYATMPNKLHFQLRMGPYTMAQAYDGHQAWAQDQNGMVSELTGFEKRDFIKSVYFGTYSYLFDDRLPGGRTYLGLEERDGELWHKVVFSPLDEDTVFCYYDMESGRQRYEVRYLDNTEGVTTMLDYRWHDGVLTSFASTYEMVEAMTSVSIQVDSMVFNPEVDRGLFERPAATADCRFPGGTGEVTVPFVTKSGHIYFEATVNGRRLSFLLDSGASTNVFQLSAVEDLELTQVGEVASKGIAGYEMMTLVQSDSIEVGRLVLHNQIGGMLDLGTLATRWDGDLPFGGVIGYDLLSRFPTLVDYEAGTLTFFDPENFEPPVGGFEIPMELTMQIPTIEATLCGIPGRFLLDLGNSLGLILHQNYWQTNELEERLDDIRSLGTAVDGVGGHAEGRTAYAAQFAFGDVRINDLRVLLSEGSDGLTGSVELAGNIGNMVLSQFRVMFDYRGQRVLFFDQATGPVRTEGESSGYK